MHKPPSPTARALIGVCLVLTLLSACDRTPTTTGATAPMPPASAASQ